MRSFIPLAFMSCELIICKNLYNFTSGRFHGGIYVYVRKRLA